jgi:hypothetical protein
MRNAGAQDLHNVARPGPLNVHDEDSLLPTDQKLPPPHHARHRTSPSPRRRCAPLSFPQRKKKEKTNRPQIVVRFTVGYGQPRHLRVPRPSPPRALYHQSLPLARVLTHARALPRLLRPPPLSPKNTFILLQTEDLSSTRSKTSKAQTQAREDDRRTPRLFHRGCLQLRTFTTGVKENRRNKKKVASSTRGRQRTELKTKSSSLHLSTVPMVPLYMPVPRRTANMSRPLTERSQESLRQEKDAFTGVKDDPVGLYKLRIQLT